MKTRTWTRPAGLLAALLVAWCGGAATASGQTFTLAASVPDDVFIFSAERQNPERDFLNAYWGDVFDALKASGIGNDVMEMISMAAGDDQQAEVQRLKDLCTQLMDGVDWDQLAGKEFVFAERLNVPRRFADNVFMGPPDFVLLFRGSGDGTARNYEGLVAMLDALVGEINKLAGRPVMSVDKTPRMGAEVASVNFLAAVSGSSPLTMAVVRHDDVIAIVMGDEILKDVLGLRTGKARKAPLSENARFKAAFAKLPPAEDSMTFFDMQCMLASMQQIMDVVMKAIDQPEDVMLHVSRTGEAFDLSNQATAEVQHGNLAKALDLLKQAHEKDPMDSRVAYNLACLQALNGNTDDALECLQRAVSIGFYCPEHLKVDSDLKSIRADKRFAKALEHATRMATQFGVEDVVVNSTKSGEAYELSMKAWEAYEKQDYKGGLELVKQAHEKSPKDARVLYYFACFQTLNGNTAQGMEYLEKSVEGGFYCPRHIANDPDLKPIRTDKRYNAALATAATMAGKHSQSENWASVVQLLVQRVLDVPAMLDYSATVGFTDGHATRMETVSMMTPDAKSKPFYPVIGKRKSMTTFERYLPQETLSFAVSNGIDISELYAFLEDTVRLAGPPGEGLLAAWDGMQKSAGLDVKNDVIACIDGQSVSVTLEGGAGSVWLVSVTDEEKARDAVTAGMDFLTTAMAEAAKQNPMMAMLAIRKAPLEHETLKGFESLFIGMQPVVWGVADGQLIFGSNADAIMLCLATARGEHPNIRTNKRAMTEAIVPDGSFVSVTLTDQRALGQELAGMIGMVSMVGGLMTAAIPDPEIQPYVGKVVGMISKLVPVVSKINFFQSTATCTTFDGQAWYTRTVTHYVPPAERTAAVAH